MIDYLTYQTKILNKQKYNNINSRHIPDIHTKMVIILCTNRWLPKSLSCREMFKKNTVIVFAIFFVGVPSKRRRQRWQKNNCGGCQKKLLTPCTIYLTRNTFALSKQAIYKLVATEKQEKIFCCFFFLLTTWHVECFVKKKLEQLLKQK